MLKYFGMLLACLLFTLYAKAQIRGTATEAGSNEILTGASVYWSGTESGTITDSEGRFEIPRNNKSKLLIFSFIGYRSDTVQIGAQDSVLNISLEKGQYLDAVNISDRQVTTSIDRAATLQSQKIAGEELHKAACCNLSQSFETNASVDAAYSDAATGAKTIRLLGLSGRYVQMMTENFPNYYGLSSVYGLEYIPGPWMDAIQVSKGTAAVINGPEAITGQINVEFLKPRMGDPLYANLLVNDKGRTEANFYGRYKLNEKWSTMLMTHHGWSLLKNDRNNDGFMDHPLVDRQFVFNRYDYFGDKGLTSRFGFKYIYENRLGGQMAYQPGISPEEQSAYGIDIRTDRFEAFWKNGYVFQNMAQTSLALINNISIHSHEGLYGMHHYQARQDSWYANLIWQSVISDERHSYHAGLSMQLDRYDEKLDAENYYRLEYMPGASLQYSMNLDNGFSLIAGIREDYHNSYGHFITPRLHMKYDFSGHTHARMSFGQGWRTAAVIAENSYLLASSRQWEIEEEIRPEVAWNGGASITHYFMAGDREWNISAEYYHTEFENQLVVDLDSDLREVRFYNLNGRSYSDTYQIELSAPFVKSMDLRAALRYNDVMQQIGGKMREVPLTSRYKAFITSSYKTPLEKWQFDATAQLNGGGRIPATSENPEAYRRASEFQAYPVFNAQITKYFKIWSIYLGVENLLDYRQEDPIIAAGDPFGDYFDAAMVWGPIEGRKFYLGFRWSLIDLSK